MAQRSNRDIAVGFLELATSGRVREAYETYVGAAFRHHNPMFAAGAAALRAAMEEAHRSAPNKAFEIQRVIADGDLVAVHSRVRRDAGDIAAVHIFRCSEGRIVELWDVGQQVPRESPNADGMF
jgi:predicted SnoaL-like aldol condensation-catalyzing enzyme